MISDVQSHLLRKTINAVAAKKSYTVKQSNVAERWLLLSDSRVCLKKLSILRENVLWQK